MLGARSCPFFRASLGLPAQGQKFDIGKGGPVRGKIAHPAHEIPGERVFQDSDGFRWHVYEQAFSDYDRRTGTSLIFASEAAVRRVRDFPPDWTTLSDVELLALSWKA